MSIVYVRLLKEGTDVYRPVSAEQMTSEVFVLSSQEVPRDEVWEFSPGTRVKVVMKELSEERVPIAVGLA
jgi:hypothetical protein